MYNVIFGANKDNDQAASATNKLQNMKQSGSKAEKKGAQKPQ